MRYERTTPLEVAAAIHRREAGVNKLALPDTFPVRDLKEQGETISPYFREKGHVKTMWCWRCKRTVPFRMVG